MHIVDLQVDLGLYIVTYLVHRTWWVWLGPWPEIPCVRPREHGVSGGAFLMGTRAKRHSLQEISYDFIMEHAFGKVGPSLN